MDNLNEFPWATATVVLLTLIAAITGAVVVIWGDPGALSFENYLKFMSAYVVGLGLLGIGRGIRSAAKVTAVHHSTHHH